MWHVCFTRVCICCKWHATLRIWYSWPTKAHQQKYSEDREYFAIFLLSRLTQWYQHLFFLRVYKVIPEPVLKPAIMLGIFWTIRVAWSLRTRCGPEYLDNFLHLQPMSTSYHTQWWATAAVCLSDMVSWLTSRCVKIPLDICSWLPCSSWVERLTHIIISWRK